MSTVEQAILRVRMVEDIVKNLENSLREAEELLRQMEFSLRDSEEADEGNIGFKEPKEWEDL